MERKNKIRNICEKEGRKCKKIRKTSMRRTIENVQEFLPTCPPESSGINLTLEPKNAINNHQIEQHTWAVLCQMIYFLIAWCPIRNIFKKCNFFCCCLFTNMKILGGRWANTSAEKWKALAPVPPGGLNHPLFSRRGRPQGSRKLALHQLCIFSGCCNFLAKSAFLKFSWS